MGALCSGVLTDRQGRRAAIRLSAVVFLVGAAMMGLASNFVVLLFGRIIAGVGVGVAGGAVPIYVSEVAPPHTRGFLISLNVLFITAGQVISYLTAYTFSRPPTSENNWRWMFGLVAVPAGVQFLAMMYVPESPRFLVQKGRDREAFEVLKKLQPAASHDTLEDVISQISRGLASSTQTASWKEVISRPEYRRPVLIAVGLQALQQFSGINTIMYFSATILQMAGFYQKENAILYSVFIALANCGATVASMRMIDHTGRRPLLLRTLVGAVIGLVVLSLSFRNPDTIPRNDGLEPSATASFRAWTSLASLVLFVTYYAMGLGCVPWTIMSEILPQSVRGKGAALAIAANWFCNFLVSITFLELINLLSPSGTFFLYSLIVSLGWVLVYKYVPETKGTSLEAVVAPFHAH
ncbi:general substrate transporter [Phlyctochytrium arcticum]|nr:general substrate transporter [Phlyctochytrium arcticum]